MVLISLERTPTKALVTSLKTASHISSTTLITLRRESNNLRTSPKSGQSQNSSEGSSHQDKDRRTSQQSRNFQQVEKLTLFKPLWTELFPDNPEIIWKISEGILIAFGDDYPTLLSHPLELRSNDKASHSVNKSSAPQDCSTTQLVSSTVHAWVVTEWPLQC